MFIDFSFHTGTVYIQDPEILNEFYVSKNKYIDKNDKSKRVMNQLFGDSILFDKSNEMWH